MHAICLKCKQKLPVLTSDLTGEYHCTCGQTIFYTNGIFRFIENDNFYEGKYTASYSESSYLHNCVTFVKRWLSIDGNEERMWNRSIKIIQKKTTFKRLEILNIGCGGGHAFLNRVGNVTAVDLSLSSLLKARELYDECYQANAHQLPFGDESFDLVFSAHLLGHIPLYEKQQVIREIYRVTKQNGYSLHSAECEANNPIYYEAKKYPELYKKYFNDMYGHYGLELPSLCKKRFTNEHFKPIIELSDSCKGLIRPVESYKVLFNGTELQKLCLWFDFLGRISKILTSNKLLSIILNIILYPLSNLNRFWGFDGADSIKLLYKKP